MPRVNVPNHVRSCWLKNRFGRSAWNSQGTCPMVGTASAEEGKSLPPSLEEQYRCKWMCQITSLATGHGWCTILGRARLEGPLSPLFPWKTELRLICSKLTRDLPHGGGCLPWRWQVPTTIIWGAAQVQINVPNYIWSCQLCTTLVNLGELCCLAPLLKFPWKLNLGWSAWNSQETCPWPRTTFPEDGKSLALSSEEQARHE